MMSRIVTVNPDRPGGFEPLLAGVLSVPGVGSPLVLGYELSGMAAGVLVADCLEHSITVRWIGVERYCRRHGIAARLLERLCGLAIEQGVEWIDAIACLPMEELGAAEALLELNGFERMEMNPVYHFPLEAVLRGPLAAAALRSNSHVRPLAEMEGQPALREFNRHIETEEGMPYPAADPAKLLKESRVWYENGKITGCVLLAPCGDGVELRWLYGQGTEALLGLLAGASAALAESYPPQTLIHMAAMVQSAEGLARKLAGEQLIEEAPVIRFDRRLL